MPWALHCLYCFHSVLSGLEGPPVSGAMAARQRRERGSLSAEEQKKAEMLDKRQQVMNKWDLLRMFALHR